MDTAIAQSSVTYANLSIHYMDIGNLEAAKDSILNACKIAPENRDYNIIAGVIFCRIHDYTLSERYYKKALKHDYFDADTRIKLSKVQLMLAKYYHSFHNLALATAVRGSQNSTHESIIFLLERQQKWQEISVVQKYRHDIHSRNNRINIDYSRLHKRLLPPKIFIYIYMYRTLVSFLRFFDQRKT